MPDLIYHMSDRMVFLFMVICTVSFSLLFVVMNKFFKFYKLTFKDNATTASVASLIGIVYGVLAGFVCLYLLTNQDHATAAALNEGAAAGNIYRESKWLKEPLRHQLQQELRKYIEHVVKVEWPEMTNGKDIDYINSLSINHMSDMLITYPIHSQTDFLIVNNLTQEINALAKGRHERIQMGGSQLSPDIWDVILLSTFLIIIINYAFRVNFKLHIFGLTAFAIMAASVLFLLVTLDRPFQGEFIVEPDALRSVVILMDHDKT